MDNDRTEIKLDAERVLKTAIFIIDELQSCESTQLLTAMKVVASESLTSIILSKGVRAVDPYEFTISSKLRSFA